MTRVLLASLLASLCCLTLGCEKKEAPAATQSAAVSAAPSAAPPPSMAAGVTRYTVANDGKTVIDGPAPGEHLKAETSGAGGWLDVELSNLAATRGEVKIDLATLKTRTFDSKDEDDKQTKDAAGWLEVGDSVKPDVREANRWATYTITSIDGVAVADASKIPAKTEGGNDVRAVTLTAHGELALHGKKVNKDAQLEARLIYPAGAPATSKPSSLVIATRAPFKITIAEHDVKPRDNFGKIASRAFGLLGTKVADVLSVTFDLRATAPAGAPAAPPTH